MSDPTTPSSSAGRRSTPWAWAALVCSVGVCCPVTTIAALVMGWKAMRATAADPAIGGRRLASAAMLIAAVALAGQIGGGWWWHANVRTPIINGPVEALAAGLSGDIAGFQARFTAPGAGAPEEEAAAFLSQITTRYGRSLGMQRDFAAAETFQANAPVINYVVTTDRGAFGLRARFVIWDDGGQLVLRWGWMEVRDAAAADLVYPVAAQAEIPPPAQGANEQSVGN